MKLKNKKTGGVDDFKIDATGLEWLGYTSLREFCEDWEDYEEPKDFWFIDPETLIACESTEPLLCDKKVAIETMKQIGNYFETKEEAQEAVKKLKAITRLKSCGFKFKGWRTADLGADKYYFVITAESDGAGKGDLDLLFSGEDE